jgi:hypothetical protein
VISLQAFVLATAGADPDTPLKKLFGFQRLVSMAPAEQRTVTFHSDATTLSKVDYLGSWRLFQIAT